MKTDPFYIVGSLRKSLNRWIYYVYSGGREAAPQRLLLEKELFEYSALST
jgi:hypothetical protein